MAIQETDWIWRNGRMVPWKEATVHVLTHALHYGTGFFEGVRVYETPDGPHAFRLRDHIRRLRDSMKIYGLELPHSVDVVVDACLETVRINGLNSAYIRPYAWIGYGGIGVTPTPSMPIEVMVAAFPWGAYLGQDGLEKGVDACVSSWSRAAPNTIPTMAKAAGNYLSSVLIGAEARRHGYAEGIGLTKEGLISEGAGENLFLVKDGAIHTPPAAAAILSGITRDTVIKLAGDLGVTVTEGPIPREMLYLADEVFMTGTAAEITPIRSVDRIPVGAGQPGPITKAVQNAFFGLFSGKTDDTRGWLEPVGAADEASHDAQVAV